MRMRQISPVITLLTDFGLKDEYVGVIKGVITSICSNVRLIDITHGIGRHDILQAALVLRSAFPYFPTGTIHVIVVDPGVGSQRRMLVANIEAQYFIAPDNGVLDLIAKDANVEELRTVTNDKYFLKPVSDTFHGRDILAPVAGHLARGVAMSEFGNRLACEEMQAVDLPVPSFSGDGRCVGKIIWADHFGNLVSNLDREAFTRFMQEKDWDKVVIEIGDFAIRGVSSSYNAVKAGMPVAVFGSRGLLEIAVNQADARQCLGVSIGQRIRVVAG